MSSSAIPSFLSAATTLVIDSAAACAGGLDRRLGDAHADPQVGDVRADHDPAGAGHADRVLRGRALASTPEDRARARRPGWRSRRRGGRSRGRGRASGRGGRGRGRVIVVVGIGVAPSAPAAGWRGRVAPRRDGPGGGSRARASPGGSAPVRSGRRTDPAGRPAERPRASGQAIAKTTETRDDDLRPRRPRSASGDASAASSRPCRRPIGRGMPARLRLGDREDLPEASPPASAASASARAWASRNAASRAAAA